MRWNPQILVFVALAACSDPAGRGPDLSSQVTPVPSTSSPAPKTSIQKLTYTFGPFALPPHSPATQMKRGKLAFRVETPVWLTSFESRLTNAKGDPIDGKFIQMAVLSNNREANGLCTSKQVGNPFAAATAHLKRVNLPEGHGYPLLPEDPLEAKIVLRNPSDEPMKDLYFTFTLTAEPMDVAQQKKDVLPLLLAMNPCDPDSLEVPPHAMVERSQSFSVPENGAVVKAVGLLQDYAVSVSVAASNDLSKPFWQGKSQLNEHHQIVDLNEFENPTGIMVRRGDPLSFGVVYDNFSNTWIHDAPAAAMLYMVRDNPSETSHRPSSNGNSHQPQISATDAQQTLLNR